MSKYFPGYLAEYLTEKLRKQNGIDIHTNVKPKEIIQKSSGPTPVYTVKLDDGSEIDTNHIVVAIGKTPNTSFAPALEIDPNNKGIVANSELLVRTDLWAAGDVVSYWTPGSERKRVEHYLHTHESGITAAQNMLGDANQFKRTEIFWGKLSGDEYIAVGTIDSKLENVGVWQKGPKENRPASTENVLDNIYEKNQDFRKGIVYYLKNKRVVGVLIWNIYDKQYEAASLLLSLREYTDYSDLQRAISFTPSVEDDSGNELQTPVSPGS